MRGTTAPMRWNAPRRKERMRSLWHRGITCSHVASSDTGLPGACPRPSWHTGRGLHPGRNARRARDRGNRPRVHRASDRTSGRSIRCAGRRRRGDYDIQCGPTGCHRTSGAGCRHDRLSDLDPRGLRRWGADPFRRTRRRLRSSGCRFARLDGIRCAGAGDRSRELESRGVARPGGRDGIRLATRASSALRGVGLGQSVPMAAGLLGWSRGSPLAPKRFATQLADESFRGRDRRHHRARA